jgi:nitroreductase
MELDEALRTTFAAREFTDDPLPEATLARILDRARFAPSGGNRQGWHVIVVRDRRTREALVELTAPAAKRYAAQREAGESPWNPVVCVDLKVVAATDQYLPRVSVVPGASIYPFVWNILLAARALGFGGTITTLVVSQEPKVRALLGIPGHVAVAAVMPLGRPVKQLTRLRRKEVPEFATRERWNGPPLTAPER